MTLQSQIELCFGALQERDFEKAAMLAPDGYKLCGYQEFAESFVYEQYGYGWAGQFEHTEVEPGLYPVFCREYFYNEREQSFTNEIKDYPGLCLWYKGTIVASNIGESISEPNTVFAHPYAHSVAKDIIEGKSKVCLLAPFNAIKVPFERNGVKLVTYAIVDNSLPSLSKDNPMLSKPSLIPPLDKQIQISKDKSENIAHPSNRDLNHTPPTKTQEER